MRARDYERIITYDWPNHNLIYSCVSLEVEYHANNYDKSKYT